MVRKPDKRVFIVWALQALAIFSVVGSALTAGIVFLTELSSTTVFIRTQAAVLILAIVYTIFRYRSWSFEIKKDHLYVEHGVLRKTYSMVPFVRIQHVDTQRSILERILRISSVVVFTAGSRGADMSLPGLDPDNAFDMQGKLRDEAVESEDSDGV